jgi:hypothetical protein
MGYIEFQEQYLTFCGVFQNYLLYTLVAFISNSIKFNYAYGNTSMNFNLYQPPQVCMWFIEFLPR